MDLEDQSELYDDYLDIDGDGHVVFDIPEEVLEPAQDFASEHGSADEQYDDDGSEELDDEELYVPTESGGDGNVPGIRGAKYAMNHTICHRGVLPRLNQSIGQRCFTWPSCQ
jgi:hypothetical protein